MQANQTKTMTPPSASKAAAKANKTTKRKYHSPLRRQQAAETRERIIGAGSELVHGLPSWDWTNLTARAVSERAGVSERTVHRHFSTERKLRDAVLQRLVEESGVKLEELSLANFDRDAERMFSYLSSFAVTSEPCPDPAQRQMDETRKLALLNAVAAETPAWTAEEQQLVAAVVDMLWQPAIHERLKESWALDTDQFSRVAGWFTSLVRRAIDEGKKP